MRLIEYASPVMRSTLSEVEPGLSEYAVEAWERMTDGGINGVKAEPYYVWRWKMGRSIGYGEWAEIICAAR